MREGVQHLEHELKLVCFHGFPWLESKSTSSPLQSDANLKSFLFWGRDELQL